MVGAAPVSAELTFRSLAPTRSYFPDLGWEEGGEALHTLNSEPAAWNASGIVALLHCGLFLSMKFQDTLCQMTEGQLSRRLNCQLGQNYIQSNHTSCWTANCGTEADMLSVRPPVLHELMMSVCIYLMVEAGEDRKSNTACYFCFTILSFFPFCGIAFLFFFKTKTKSISMSCHLSRNPDTE